METPSRTKPRLSEEDYKQIYVGSPFLKVLNIKITLRQ